MLRWNFSWCAQRGSGWLAAPGAGLSAVALPGGSHPAATPSWKRCWLEQKPASVCGQQMLWVTEQWDCEMLW